METFVPAELTHRRLRCAREVSHFEVKEALDAVLLTVAVMEECAKAIGVEKSYIWVYICDADKTAEFGAVLPEPGQEKAWVEKLPKEVKQRYGIE